MGILGKKVVETKEYTGKELADMMKRKQNGKMKKERKD
jgi:hypothetical protein